MEGTKKGETLRWPLLSSFAYVAPTVEMSTMPQPIATPARSLLHDGSQPAG